MQSILLQSTFEEEVKQGEEKQQQPIGEGRGKGILYVDCAEKNIRTLFKGVIPALPHDNKRSLSVKVDHSYYKEENFFIQALDRITLDAINYKAKAIKNAMMMMISLQ